MVIKIWIEEAWVDDAQKALCSVPSLVDLSLYQATDHPLMS